MKYGAAQAVLGTGLAMGEKQFGVGCLVIALAGLALSYGWRARAPAVLEIG